jgi:hypothetical protein
MRAVLLNLCLLIAGLQGFSAPQASPATPAANAQSAHGAEHEIIALSKDKWAWMAERRLDLLESLFHADAVFVHMGGNMTTRQELDVIQAGRIQYKRADILDASARILGSTAIVLSRIRLLAVVGGNEVTNPFMVTEVYVQQGGGWKLVQLSFSRLLGE